MSTTTPTPVFSDFTSDPRLAHRRSIRERMAERDVLRSRRGELENVVRTLDSDLDNATSRHQATTGPIQAEITTIERQRINLMADRKPVPASIDLRRRELLNSLNAANVELEAAAADHKTRVAVLKREIKAIAESEKRYADLTPFSLQHPSVANPALLDRHWVAQRAIEFAQHRVRAAAEKIKTYESEIAKEKTPRSVPLSTVNLSGVSSIDHGTIGIYSDRLRRWRLELTAAEKWMADALAESEKIRQAILDE